MSDGELVKVDKQEVVVSAEVGFIQMIERAARDPSVDIDKLERLMQMHERMVAKKAEADFNDAMTACQKEMRSVSADATNPQTRSKYASYAKLDHVLRPIYTKHGISISYGTEDTTKAETVRVIAYVARGGYTRIYRVDMPADGKGAKGGDVMTKTHATGAAMAYGSRYLLKSIFNVSVGEDDVDGNDVVKMPEATKDKFKSSIEALQSVDAAKTLWQEIAKACHECNDLASHDALKELLLAKRKALETKGKEMI
jgi:hypothetical protein